MANQSEDKHEEKGDEVLRRMLKMPPDHKPAPKPKPGRGEERNDAKP